MRKMTRKERRESRLFDKVGGFDGRIQIDTKKNPWQQHYRLRFITNYQNTIPIAVCEISLN